MREAVLRGLLRSVGVMPYYVGCRYFEEAVLLAMEEPLRLQNIQSEIYLPIARRHGVSVTSVEKNLRTVRDVMMRHNGAELFCELSGFRYWHNKLPYPKEIIAVFAEYLNREQHYYTR